MSHPVVSNIIAVKLDMKKIIYKPTLTDICNRLLTQRILEDFLTRFVAIDNDSIPADVETKT